MLRLLNALLTRSSATMVASLSLVFIVLLAAVDYLTGQELSFSVFYLIPIAVAAWYGGGKLGYIISGVSTFAWLAVEGTATEPYSRDWIVFWNSGVRLLLFVVFVYLLAELKLHLRREQQLARTDSLTGLLNRSGFMDQAGALITAAARYEQAVTIAYIDVDGFKAINDKLGHSKGDEVLTAIGTLLGLSRRKSDIVGRMGGDEFAVLLPNTNLSGANAFFENLHYLLEKESRNRQWPGLGISIGAAVFERGPTDLAEGLQVADELMYKAKKSGPSNLVVESVKRGNGAAKGTTGGTL